MNNYSRPLQQPSAAPGSTAARRKG